MTHIRQGIASFLAMTHIRRGIASCLAMTEVEGIVVRFWRFAALVAALVVAVSNSARAQYVEMNSYPFDGKSFTTYDKKQSSVLTDNYIEFQIPFYDDRRSHYLIDYHRFLSNGSIEFFDGSEWSSELISFTTSRQEACDWYWVNISNKNPLATMYFYDSRNDSWTKSKTFLGVPLTSRIECLREGAQTHSYSPTFVRVRLFYDNGWCGNRPLAFRFKATWVRMYKDVIEIMAGAKTTSNTQTWYLDAKENPYVVWMAGRSMHKPTVTGYTINTDGTVKVDATIPDYDAWDDKGTVQLNGYTNTKNITLDNVYIGNDVFFYNCDSVKAFGSFTSKMRVREYFNASHNIYAENGRFDMHPSYSSILSEAYSVPAYPCPSNLTASAKNGNIILNWNMVKGTADSEVDDYQIYWRKGTGAWQKVNVTKSYDPNDTRPSVSFPYPEINVGTNNYQFLVARGKFVYSNTEYNAVTTNVSIGTDKILVSGVNANLQSDGSIKVTWTTDGGRTGSDFRYVIYRKAGTEAYAMVRTITTEGEKEYIDDDVTSCTAYLYQVRVTDGTVEYNEKATTEAIVIPDNNVGTISDLSVSKGFYNDRVNISWKVSAGAGFKRFSIMRKIKSQPNAPEQQIYEVASSGLAQYAYDDMNGSAGTYYDYRVLAWTECSGTVAVGGSLISTGFKQPYGLVSGKVSYGAADVAVAGVSIKAVGETDYANKSLEFSSDEGTGIRAEYKEGTLSNNAFSFQAWIMVRNEQSTINSFMDAAGKYAVEVDGDNVWLSVYKGNNTDYDEYVFSKTVFPRNVFKHVSVTYQQSGSSGTAILYIDGEEAERVTKTGVQAYTFPSDSSVDNLIYFGRYWEEVDDDNLDGYMDEIRLWNRVLTASEISNNYNAYLSGGESGLTLYYRLDEQAGDEIFDVSKKNGVFNECHGELLYNGGVNMRSLVVPSSEQLSIRTVTDSNGAYILNTIPYTGDGSMFTLSPSLGAHQFNPSDKPLYFNQQSAAYSNINFSDISSFTVRGRVVYEGGNYPVKGCSFEVDGQTVVSANGSALQTDADGAFEITVPIGTHSVRVIKSGHTFASDGYLLGSDGKNLYYNAPVADVKFQDQTKVKLIGRVVGGSAEYGKPLGFGESVNNIGVETIELTPVLQQYDYVSTSVTKSYSHNDGQWSKPDSRADDSTKVVYEKKKLTIHVSDTTGEYVAWVYPEAYNIQPISVSQGASQPVLKVKEDVENIDLSSTAVPDASYLQKEVRVWDDSTFVQGVAGVVDHWEYFERADTVSYNAKWTYKYQATPTFGVKQVVDGSEADYFGEKEYIMEDALEGTKDTLELYNAEADTFLFGKPVFRQGVKYHLRFNAYEQYTNHVFSPAVTVTYPVTGGAVNLTNNLQVATAPEEYETDSEGILDYTFTAGAPNLTTATGDIFATLSLGAVSYYWNLAATGLVPDNSTPLTAWQLGEKSTGTNFMTSGPDQLSAILRDPPGTASFAYIEQGSTISSTSTTSTGTSVAQELNLTTSLGTKITTFVGLGAGIITESEVKADVSAGLSSEQSYSSENEATVTTTFTERFETSPLPDYVGAMGDVFIGNSTNILYGLTNGVSIQKGVVSGTSYSSAGDYTIASSAAIAYGQEFNTRFAYTASELENIMLPKWRNSIAGRLLRVGTDEPNTAVITSPVYISKLDAEDENFGKWNLDAAFKTSDDYDLLNPYDGASYKIYFPDAWTPTSEMMKSFQDSVLWANNQIAMWEEVLAQNEKEKVEMTGIRNYSFGGGTSIQYSEATSSSTSYSHTFGFNITPSIGAVAGGEVMGIGMELTTGVAITTETAEGRSGSSETSITTGFTLAEEGDDDELTVDYGKTAGGTFAFKTRGGQTSCPYEGEVLTQYYHPGQYVLQEATMRIEVPVINVASANQILNVPSNRAASFTLAMQNESEVGEDVRFELIVDEATNPDGAELKIDGGVVGNGRTFLVRAGETLNKTLTLSKGVADSYSNIGLILRSTCQSDPTGVWEVIADTCWVSAEFVPACSDVVIAAPANNFTVNTETGDTVKVTLQGFDVNFPNFGYIRLEARSAGTPTWTTLRTFYPSNLFAKVTDGTAEDIAGRAAIVYDWVMKNNADGQYELRATTASVNIVADEIVGNPLSTYSTDAITGYKDMVKPVAMGAPSPANGVYGLGDELSVTYNENINTAMVISDNIAVTYGAAATPVPVTFVTSSNKITVVYPEDYFALLEDSVITLTVSDIYDMRGNKSEPVTWQAYVNRNPLVWETDEVSLVKEAGAVMSFTAKIRNAGNTAVSYSFTGLPQWLSVNQPTGTLAALTVKELTFNISSGVNLGVYSSLLGLTSGNGIVKKLPLNLTVTGALPEGWAVNPGAYESNMTVTGRIQIAGVAQSDPADILGAFIDDECVGLTSPIDYNGLYYTFLTVYGNSAHAGRSVKFKLWDASSGNVYSVVESSVNGAVQTINFAADATHGTASAPVIHNAQNIIEQRINLINGWNWLSVNVVNSNPTIMQQFKERVGTAGELLKGQGVYIQTPTWGGTLNSIEKEKMYVLKTNAVSALLFDGTPADPAATPLTLVSGWNWLGYIPQFTLPVNEALANLTPSTDDQIKGQTSYRTYAGAGVGWIGTLNYLRAGEGYMYKSLAAAGKTFKYPSSATQLYRAPVSARSAASSAVVNRWTPDVHKYPNTMTMTSVVWDDNIEQHSDMLEIGAFAANGECRGSVMLQHEPLVPTHPYIGFLMVFGENGESLTFKVYNHATDVEFPASNTVSFAADAIHGTPLNPYQFRSLAMGNDVVGASASASAEASLAVYPNPVVDKLMITNYALLDIEHVSITDITGRTLYSATSVADGYIDVSGYSSGIYLIRFVIGSGENAQAGVRSLSRQSGISNPQQASSHQSPDRVITLKFVKK
jgi:hypothetical protein